MGNIFCENCHTEPTYCNTIQETAVINSTCIHVKSGDIMEEEDALVIYITPFLDPINLGQKRLLENFLPFISKKLSYIKSTEVIDYGTTIPFMIDEEDENFQWVLLTVLPMNLEAMKDWFIGLKDVLEKKEISKVSLPFQSIIGFSKEQISHSFISIVTSNINPESHSSIREINIYSNECIILRTLSTELSHHSDRSQSEVKTRVNSYDKQILGFSRHASLPGKIQL